MIPFPWRSWRHVLLTALTLAVKAGVSRTTLHAIVDDAYDDLATIAPPPAPVVPFPRAELLP